MAGLIEALSKLTQPQLTVLATVLASVIGASSALLGAISVAAFNLWREKSALKRQDTRDLAYLAVTVGGALERFSAACVDVALDNGLGDGPRRQWEELSPKVATPTFQPELVQVEWKVLPADLIFPILDLPFRVENADRMIAGLSEHGDDEDYFRYRRYYYAELGADAARLVLKLRNHAGFPQRPENPDWKPIEKMDELRREIQAFWDRPHDPLSPFD